MPYDKTTWNPGGPPGISAENLNKIESGVEAAHKLVETDIHTPDQSQTAQASGTLLALQSFIANMLKRILGTTNWHDAPPTTLTAAKSHIDAASPHSGHATTTALTAHTSAAAPHSGHETPTGAQAKVDTHAAGTNVHGATSAATANRIMLRDANGRAKVAAPAAADDIARKDTVDVAVAAVDAAVAALEDVVEAHARDQYELHMELYYTGHHSGPSIAGLTGMTFDGFVDTSRVDGANTTAVVNTTNKQVVGAAPSLTLRKPISAVAEQVPGIDNRYPPSSPQNSIDNNETTYSEVSHSSDWSFGGAIVYDLGAVYNLHHISVLSASGESEDNADIGPCLVSLDKVNWTETAGQSGITISKTWRDLSLGNQNGRYVALGMYAKEDDNAQDSDCRVYEVAVYSNNIPATSILRSTVKTLAEPISYVVAFVSMQIPSGCSVAVAISADNGAHWETMTQESSRADPQFPTFTEYKYTKDLQYPGKQVILRLTLTRPDAVVTPIIKRYGLYWS